MLTPFEAGKNAEELGIDTSRTFVVVDGTGFNDVTNGDRLKLVMDDRTSSNPYFKNITKGKIHHYWWSRLAYAPEPTPEVKEEYVPPTTCSNKSHAVEHVEYKPGEIAMCAHCKVPWSSVEEYVPRKGDLVNLRCEVIEKDASTTTVQLPKGMTYWMENYETSCLTLLSRPTPKRKITRKELEEMVGGEFEIVD